MYPLACSAAAPSRLRHALSSARHLILLHWGQDAHFAAVVIANSLEGALLRGSLSQAARHFRSLAPQQPLLVSDTLSLQRDT